MTMKFPTLGCIPLLPPKLSEAYGSPVPNPESQSIGACMPIGLLLTFFFAPAAISLGMPAYFAIPFGPIFLGLTMYTQEHVAKPFFERKSRYQIHLADEKALTDSNASLAAMILPASFALYELPGTEGVMEPYCLASFIDIPSESRRGALMDMQTCEELGIDLTCLESYSQATFPEAHWLIEDGVCRIDWGTKARPMAG